MTSDSDNSQPNADALEALVRDCQGALLCYTRSLVRDEEAARDIVQDTFLTYLKAPPKPVAVKAWLYRVCRSRAIDHIRRQRSVAFGMPENGEETFFDRQPDPAPSPAESAAAREDISALTRQLETLTPRQQELVRLKFQAGLSYKEIAETAGLTVTNVGFILHDALATLRARLTANKLSS